MNFRLLQQEDIPAAGAIVGQNYNEDDQLSATAELEAMFKDGVIKPTYYVAEDQGEIVGFGGYMQSSIDYAVYELFWINVRIDRQRQGIGKAIIKTLINEIASKEESRVIILSATSPEYYETHFNFKAVESFKGSEHEHFLMSLVLVK